MSLIVKRVQFVVEGRVHCPVRHTDVDVEECLGCRRLDDIDLDSRHPRVVCRLDGTELDPMVTA